MMLISPPHARFDYPFHAPDLDPHNRKYCVVGTCHGLLFLFNVFHADINDSLFLWNPCVGKLLKLPSPNITYATHGRFRTSIGFGFDPKTKDYKVIRVVTVLDSLHFEQSRPQVEIYTLSTGQWRMLRTDLAPICALFRSNPQTFVNGALHWVAFRISDDYHLHNFVLVFDLGDEDNGFLHIWTMKDIRRALGFQRNGEVILKLDGGRLISQDLETLRD
nr:f-box/kelch-repeat protein [Quercus suber]